jgi:hypothetical protein
MCSTRKIGLTGKARRGQMFQGVEVESKHAYYFQSRSESGIFASPYQ